MNDKIVPEMAGVDQAKGAKQDLPEFLKRKQERREAYEAAQKQADEAPAAPADPEVKDETKE